jgi:electron transport complex protein RnfB
MLNEEYRGEKFTGVAVINELLCIGCTKCIPPCPVDAIVGSTKHMHTVIASECTGCGLCVAPCPVDCIEMRALQQSWDSSKLHEKAVLAERRHDAQLLRKARELAQQKERANARKVALTKIRPTNPRT